MLTDATRAIGSRMRADVLPAPGGASNSPGGASKLVSAS